mgnify:CR=1 FL=1
MAKVKTFTSRIEIFKTVNELKGLDGQVNKFIRDNKIKRVISVNDACTTDNSGATIGMIRVVAYE